MGIFIQILHFFIVSKDGNYKAPSLNFLWYLILIIHKEYWPDEYPYCAFLAKYILRGNGDNILFIFVIFVCCGVGLGPKLFIPSPHCGRDWKKLSDPIYTQATVRALPAMSP